MSALAPGSRLGHYDILDSLGAGGMGEVYRATDTRLKRQVALKVLPSSVTADPDRLARFQREAEVLASLNHPNIAGLHGIEESDGVKALVMELVEGPTLADRIAQGPIPVEEALTIARQIAEALAAAHDRNIIHRDLKPANIKLRPDGEVKVLDFGLAKAMDQGSGIGDQGSGKTILANSPTITSPAMTMHGVILGTAAYMSPEQAAGRPVDRRTDLWAFGVVLMEMLTGRQVFAGESVTDIIASVLKDEPDWKALPASTPPSIHRLLRRCLERDRKKRWPDAATARMECDDALVTGGQTVAAVSRPAAAIVRSPWHLAGAVVAGVAIAAVVAWTRWPAPRPVPESSRFAIDLPADQRFTRAGRHVLALSPDGMQLVYVANQQLFIHSFRDLTTKVIEGSENVDPSEPVFSPDGAWVAYWSNGVLKKIPTGGGSAVQLVELGNPLGLTWTGDQILAGQPRSIVQVPANGGAAKTLVTIDKPVGDWVQSPQLIDEGRAVLFTLRTDESDWNRSNIVVQDLQSGTRTTLIQGGTDGRALPGGMLFYARENALFAVAFDERRREVSSTSVPLERDVLPSVGGFSGASQATWSAAGTLAYVMDDTASASSLSWMTRQGVIEPTLIPPQHQFPSFASLALSPDGTRVAIRLSGNSRSQSDLWVGDIGRGAMTRLTSTGTATDPVWTPDGARVCYGNNAFEVRCQSFDGSAPPERLFQIDRLSTVAGISRDSEWLLISMNAGNGAFDVWAGPNRSPYELKPLLATPASETLAALSPDGRWIAYRGDESGRDEVYVRPFPNVHQGRWQVSTTGATAPRWSKDGRELYYLATGTAGAALQITLTAVPVQTQPSFRTGAPTDIGLVPTRGGYDVAADGRFLITSPVSGSNADSTRPRIVVVQNWLNAAKARMSAAAARP
jgi:Tol biopolymer transport system component